MKTPAAEAAKRGAIIEHGQQFEGDLVAARGLLHFPLVLQGKDDLRMPERKIVLKIEFILIVTDAAQIDGLIAPDPGGVPAT